ncbi:MAG: hypothetical protein GY906_00595, partial [bacterium]|nr:hypothetical protein [bacterium]
MPILIGILILAAALRFSQLGSEGLWSDEAHTFACARLPAAELIRSTAEDNHAPAYFMLIKPVLSALGS